MGADEGGFTPSRRDDLDKATRAVSDTLDELLWRHHGIATSWSNPEDFLRWLLARGYEVVVADDIDEHDWTLRPESDTYVCDICGAER